MTARSTPARRVRLTGLFAAALFLTPAACADSSLAGEGRVAELEPGEALYERHCALCHGRTGEADGPAAFLLFPPARDFTFARFKLASTKNSIPTDADLVATLKRGMPGSAMPSWGWMEEEDLGDLAGYVRKLAVEGLAEKVFAAYEEDGASWRQASQLAGDRLVPGNPVEIGSAPEPTEELLERGRRLYESRCADCHGVDDRGPTDALLANWDATRNTSRDFATGILKGGATYEDLARRILTGMHGTAMPGNTFMGVEDVQATVTYLRTLLPADANERGVQHREHIRVARVESLPEGPGWAKIERTAIALAPLWWRRDAVLAASIAAVHDGDEIAIRIRWEDATADSNEGGMSPYADAVALQFSSAEDPPLFGMSTEGPPSEIWHWKAADLATPEEIAASLRVWPHGIGDWLADNILENLPRYQATYGTERITSRETVVQAFEMKPLADQLAFATTIETRPVWENGAWDVVLRRPLDPIAGEVSLAAGSRVLMSCAVWNGALRDLRGQKSTSIWHVLEIER